MIALPGMTITEAAIVAKNEADSTSRQQVLYFNSLQIPVFPGETTKEIAEKWWFLNSERERESKSNLQRRLLESITRRSGRTSRLILTEIRSI